MTRHIRKTIIQAKIEEGYGTGPGAWVPTNGILIIRPKFRIRRDVVARELLHAHMGGSEQLIGARVAEIEFDVEMGGSGAAGTAPPWGILLRACGMSETVTADTRVEYSPVSTGFESLTLRYFIDGVIHTARGCRGTVKFEMNAYGTPMMKFKFLGFDTSTLEGALDVQNFSAWQRPLVITDANAGDIILGGTYMPLAWISDGVSLPSRGMEVDLGNKVTHLKLLGGEEVDIAERETSGKMSVALSAADEVAWRTDINDNVLTTLGFNFGTVGGNKIVVWCPNVQRVAPEAEDFEGKVLFATELRVLPDAGNDEVTITVK